MTHHHSTLVIAKAKGVFSQAGSTRNRKRFKSIDIQTHPRADHQDGCFFRRFMKSVAKHLTVTMHCMHVRSRSLLQIIV